jgi:hypothetical protein
VGDERDKFIDEYASSCSRRQFCDENGNALNPAVM